MRFFMMDILEMTRKENMRAIGENPFFVVLAFIFEQHALTNEFIIHAIKELIKQLSQLSSFKGCFKNIEENRYFTI